VTAGSLRLRLFLAGVVSVVVALGLASLGLSLLFERHVERRMATDLALMLDELVSGLDRDAEGNLAVVDEPGDARFDRPLSGLYWQITRDPNGLVARSRSLWDSELPLPADELAEGALHQHRISGPRGTSLLAVEPADQLVQHQCEIGRDAPLDMAFEQEREAERREPERDHDRYDAGEKQPQPQRARGHAGRSGMR
jgi:hypothetical protein